MPTAETLRALIALVKEAKGPDRRLDYEIFVAFAEPGQSNSWDPHFRHHYATSIDAALALVAKVLPESRPHDVLHDAIERMNLTGWRADAPQVPQLALHVIGEMLERLMPSEETAHVER